MAKTSKTAKKSTALVTLLLDRSGSMNSIKPQTIEGFNAYVGTMQKDKESKFEFTFLQFDDVSLDKVCVAESIDKVAFLNDTSFTPRGNTPLVDAAYKTIKAIEKALKKRDDNPKIIVAIQTDGFENASTEYTFGALNALITEKTAQGWQFNFMGAGIDAYNQAAAMGISRGQTMSYGNTMAETVSAFAESAVNNVSYASGAMGNTQYSMRQKFAAGDKFDRDVGKASFGQAIGVGMVGMGIGGLSGAQSVASLTGLVKSRSAVADFDLG